MKTNFKLLLAAVVVFTLTTRVNATETKPSNEPAMISKINVSGNVEVYITQGTSESIKIAGEYNPDKELIATEDGELKIASYSKDTLTLIVTVTSLEGIEADGSAKIISTNKLKASPLDVNLSDSASAILDADKSDLKQDLNDSSTLILTGEDEQ